MAEPTQRRSRARVLAGGVGVVVLAAGALLALTSGQVKLVEARLGTRVPAAATDVHAHHTQPGPDGGFVTWYLRFDLDQPGFEAFVREAKLDPDSRLLPPTRWAGPSAKQLGWWRPLPTTPSNAAARELPTNGFIAAKWEDGHAYVLVVDPGPENGTPGPY